MSRPPGSSKTHDRILSAAHIVFSEKGYFDATMKDIADKADCNTVTVFRHFESKETLLKAVVERFHEFVFDAEELESRLSYMNIYGDFRIMADSFFVCIYHNIHTIRIYINDSRNFDFINKNSWFIPEALKSFVSGYITSMYMDKISAADAAMIAEMFVCYIVRTCLRLNVHEGIEESSRQLVKEARPIMNVSVDMTVDSIRLLVDKKKKEA